MYKFFKRLFDILLSLLGFIITLPITIIVSILIKLTSKGPIFFKQERIGKNGKTFWMIKFRSMIVNAEHTGSGCYSGENDPRVTKIGKFIRKTSIDEIPQFINILKGEMSFIGPRPVLTYHPWTIDKYTKEQFKRFDVLPGITGWAQVHGRKQVIWEERIKYDCYYVDNLSFLLDLKIVFMTIFQVLKNENNVNTIRTVKDDKMLKLMYITNNPEVAKIADENGVNRVWIDLEIKGKELRQPKILNTVISKHEISDIPKVKKVLKNSELIVRVNSIDDESKKEINDVIEAGADIVMLPYFKTIKEVKFFLKEVDGRAKTCLLLETPEAVDILDDILKLKGIDEIHIGLNDLHLGYHMKFMFELLADGTVEKICSKIKNAGIDYGFGGIARVGEGTLPAEAIIAEHYRLGSSIAILSRSFCDTSKVTDLDEIKELFKTGVKDIRNYEEILKDKDEQFYNDNKEFVQEKVQEIVDSIKMSK